MALITINTDPLLDIVDTLTSAGIRTDAIYLAAGSLNDMQKDAIQMLTTDLEGTIEHAKQLMERLIQQGKDAIAEDIRNG